MREEPLKNAGIITSEAIKPLKTKREVLKNELPRMHAAGPSGPLGSSYESPSLQKDIKSVFSDLSHLGASSADLFCRGWRRESCLLLNPRLSTLDSA